MRNLFQDIITLPLKLLAYFCYEFRQKDIYSIVFCSFKNSSYNFNSKYLFEYLQSKGYNCAFVLNDNALRKKLNKTYDNSFISSNSLVGLRTIFLAKIWITSTGLPVRIPYASKNRSVINLWHGVALKKVGILEHDISISRKFIVKYIYRNNYSLLCVTSENLRKIYAESFMCDKKNIGVFGQPQNDQLLNYSYSYARRKLEGIFDNHPITKQNILYCPTYRANQKTSLFPFSDFDVFKLKKYLAKNRITIFIRLHPLDLNQDIGYISGPLKMLPEDIVPDIVPILGAFDLLITDYSSLYIDFLLLNRPLIFLPFDLKKYSLSRGLNFEYSKVTPGPKPITQLSFIQEMQKLLCDHTYYQAERESVRDFFHDVFGNSCKLIRKYIDNAQRSL